MMKKGEFRAAKKIHKMGPPDQVIDQVHLLPEPMAQALREMIVQGASPEFAAEEVNKRHDWDGAPKAGTDSIHPVVHPMITLPAAQQYCRADLDLQRDRAHYLVKTAESVTRSLSESGNLEEGDCRYVHAVVMSGLARINQGDSTLSTKEALRAREELRNLKLKNLMMKLREQDARRRHAYLEAQKNLAEAKRSFVHVQTRKLRDVVSQLGKRKRLTPETFQKIQETYGLLAQNVSDTSMGPSAAELQALAAGSAPEPDEAAHCQEYYFHSPEQVARELARPVDKLRREPGEVNAQEEKMPGS
ncbi:MAG TPA: hypothetical protein VG028_04170 [Terriglobia bacterium]|nr:hypothetical protein [Terriglobia bacterium]